ncbi:glutathione transferase GstA [Sphingomonas sp. QA11]|uniref:glutathione transferase GstA n=1 Tax=Sphingomonas sp. QA11 TaxID=2950605 RepID=UPI002349413D|nr:glutathione transferase GstA [Sphingomonas sp. QA11]WCM25980.1 glutathione transferase GstA [Sphingomonas sp. QA11]
MKLYYAPGACSLAALIAAEEAGLRFELERVDIRANPHRLADGTDFHTINAKGYVPMLELEDGDLLTEGVAILQYIGDEWSERTMFDHYRQLEWLTFIATELHKSFSPWLFHPEYGEQAAAVARARIADRFSYLDQHLQSTDYLLGDHFGVADAYCFAIARWAPGKGIDLAEWPFLSAYLDRVRARPKVAAALERHG